MKLSLTGTEILILSVIVERYVETGEQVRRLANIFYEAYYNRSAKGPLPDILPDCMMWGEIKEFDFSREEMGILLVLLASYDAGSPKITTITNKFAAAALEEEDGR